MANHILDCRVNFNSNLGLHIPHKLLYKSFSSPSMNRIFPIGSLPPQRSHWPLYKSCISPQTSYSPLTPNAKVIDPDVDLREHSSATEPRGLAFELFKPVPGCELQSPSTYRTTKISVIGVGNVGMACAQTCLTEDLVDELALIDVQAEKLRGEMLDLQHAAAFLPRVKIVADTNYEVSAGSDICIVTAGARQREGESRLSLLGRNVSLFQTIIPQLIRHSPDTILLIVANPVDILTYISWKLTAGALPPNRVIGTGTNLDSSRLRFLIADKFNVNAHNIHGYMVGEHGDSSVPLWSNISIANVPILELRDATDGKKYTKKSLHKFHEAVVGSAYEVIKLKGYTSWAIGYSVASLVKSILRDQRRIHPVSVLANGFYGIDKDVYLSLPSQLGRAGILGVANLNVDEEELQQLQKSATTIWDTQANLKL